MPPNLLFTPPGNPDSYTYLGGLLDGRVTPFSRLLGLDRLRPVYMHDRARRLSSLILGRKGSGKTEFLLSLALRDALAGRSVILIDAKPEKDTLRKFAYYARAFGVSLRCLLPYEEGGMLSCSWNPLWPQLFPVGEMAGLLLRSFRPAAKEPGASEEYWSAAQAETLSLLLRALYSTGKSLNLDDLLCAITGWPHSLDALLPLCDGEGKKAVGEIQEKIAQLGEREYAKITTGLSGFVSRLTAWQLLSYRPSIRLDRALEEPGILYVGLPLDRDRDAMATIGRLLLGSLRLLTSRRRGQSSDRLLGSILVDEAEAFLDQHATDWIAKARTSGYSISLSVHSLADLGRQRERLLVLSDHLVSFRTTGAEAQEIVKAAGGARWERVHSVSSGDGSGKRITESGRSAPEIPPEMITTLRAGQCVFFPGFRVTRPIPLATCMLPDPPPGPLPQPVRTSEDAPPPLRLDAKTSPVQRAVEVALAEPTVISKPKNGKGVKTRRYAASP